MKSVNVTKHFFFNYSLLHLCIVEIPNSVYFNHVNKLIIHPAILLSSLSSLLVFGMEQIHMSTYYNTRVLNVLYDGIRERNSHTI